MWHKLRASRVGLLVTKEKRRVKEKDNRHKKNLVDGDTRNYKGDVGEWEREGRVNEFRYWLNRSDWLWVYIL